MKKTIFMDVDKLERARINKGLFKNEVGRIAGVGQVSTYRVFNTGECGIRVARRIAAALDLELKDLWVNVPVEWRR